jgi:F420-0:gamma-glutamyl ligase
VVITSKIVSLCENRVLPIGQYSKEELVKKEADQYVPFVNKYGFHFTISKNTLIPAAGIDESNSDDNYVLWPINAQKTANNIRDYLVKKSKHKNIGVVITDSTCMPLRRGTTGIYLAHSGFKALNNYVGKPDLFGRPFTVSQSNVASGLAATAVLCMGEGAEQTPICFIYDAPFVQFQDRNPTKRELNDLNIPLDEDIFAPFLTAVEWKSSKGENTND